MTKMTQKQIDASLDSLRNDIAAAVESATTMKKRVQHALMSCLSHWRMTGSNTGLKDIINQFIEDLGNGVKCDSVVAWCQANLGMIIAADEKSIVFGTMKSTELDPKKAAEKPWYEYAKKNPFAFDLKAKIIALAKSAEKAQKAHALDKELAVSINDNLYAQLATLAVIAEGMADTPQGAPVVEYDEAVGC